MAGCAKHQQEHRGAILQPAGTRTDAGQHDEVAVAPLAHARQHGLDQVDVGEEVDLERVVHEAGRVRRLGELLDGADEGLGRGAQQHVDAAEGVHRLCHGGLALADLSGVERDDAQPVCPRPLPLAALRLVEERVELEAAAVVVRAVQARGQLAGDDIVPVVQQAARQRHGHGRCASGNEPHPRCIVRREVGRRRPRCLLLRLHGAAPARQAASADASNKWRENSRWKTPQPSDAVHCALGPCADVGAALGPIWGCAGGPCSLEPQLKFNVGWPKVGRLAVHRAIAPPPPCLSTLGGSQLHSTAVFAPSDRFKGSSRPVARCGPLGCVVHSIAFEMRTKAPFVGTVSTSPPACTLPASRFLPESPSLFIFLEL